MSATAGGRPLALVAAGAALGAALAVLLLQRRQEGAAASPAAAAAGETGTASMPGGGAAEGGRPGAKRPLPPPEVEEEFFSRSQPFFGDEGHQKVRGAYVVVVGLGGVGSHAAHMLCRAGVATLRMVDFDQVSVSSLNRHAVAALADVGRSKVGVLAEKLGQINPWCNVDARAVMFTGDKAAELLAADPATGKAKPDYVVDAIDDLTTKTELLKYCAVHDIPVVMAGGAGAKADFTRLCLGNINDAAR